MANHYDIPKWAGKPAVGLHLDVSKGEKLIQKLMIDEKKCYLFGRNPQINDFVIDHTSCSRVHAVLVYHKALNMAFLVDLGSTHGTHIGKIQLEAHKPTQCPVNSTFHFGASTRMYTLRERPQTAPKPVMEELESMQTGEGGEGALLGLPETETELENLTEFNTAHNRRITMLGIEEDEARPRKRHKFNISFKDEEDVINPEDVDPSIGRFRNLLQTTVVPNKKRRIDAPSNSASSLMGKSVFHNKFSSPLKDFSSNLYDDLPPDSNHAGHHHSSHLFSSFLTTKLGLPMPNPAPDVELQPPEPTPAELAPSGAMMPTPVGAEDPNEPKKKKYAKEAWPGRKHNPLLV